MTRNPRSGDDVQVECWCRTEIVWVPIEDVWKLLTGTCGRAVCKKPTSR